MDAAELKRNFTLIGFSGVGKTTYSRLIAQEFGYEHIDIDERLRGSRETLQELVDEVGEEEFLRLEEQEVLSLERVENAVIDPGGSIIYSREGMQFLKRHSIIIYLADTFDSIEKRADFRERPIVGLNGRTYRELFFERAPLYRGNADLILPLTEQNNDAAVINPLRTYLK